MISWGVRKVVFVGWNDLTNRSEKALTTEPWDISGPLSKTVLTAKNNPPGKNNHVIRCFHMDIISSVFPSHTGNPMLLLCGTCCTQMRKWFSFHFSNLQPDWLYFYRIRILNFRFNNINENFLSEVRISKFYKKHKKFDKYFFTFAVIKFSPFWCPQRAIMLHKKK